MLDVGGQIISVCNSERIIKIGQYLQKLCSNKKGPFLSASLYLVKEALIEIGCVVTSLVVGWLVVGRWLSRACTVAKRCILGL